MRSSNTMKFTRVLPIVVCLLISSQASAVVLYWTDQRNTYPPGSLLNPGSNASPHGPGDPRRLLNSGWQWQGQFGSFLGTPIAPQYFITAQHIGGAPEFVLNGVSYSIDTSFNAGADTPGYANGPNSDLRIWKINGTFPSWAPLYTEAVGSEVGRNLVVFGRGASRGPEVRVNGVLKGWEWGVFDSVQAWGENTVTNIYNAGAFGLLLGFHFDADGGPNEAALSAGDSGGAVFIQSGGQWKLAGINFSVDGPWRYTQFGPEFNATIFDGSGLWLGNPAQMAFNPGRSFSTLISSNVSWIQSVVGASVVPEPATSLLAMALVPMLLRRRRSGIA